MNHTPDNTDDIFCGGTVEQIRFRSAWCRGARDFALRIFETNPFDPYSRADEFAAYAEGYQSARAMERKSVG